MNHPGDTFLCADLHHKSPRDAVPWGTLDLLLAAPSCTFHSRARGGRPVYDQQRTDRSEEHTSELQSLMRISYAVFCLKKKITEKTKQPNHNIAPPTTTPPIKQRNNSPNTYH